jgi:hypothetical protein
MAMLMTHLEPRKCRKEANSKAASNKSNADIRKKKFPLKDNNAR